MILILKRIHNQKFIAFFCYYSGSYDHTAKVWNLESEEDKPLVTVDHGAPVESLLFISESSLLATAGGQLIKLWNISVGGKLLYTLHNHHKTVRPYSFGLAFCML